MGLTKIDNIWHLLYLSKLLAGTTVHGGNTLFADFIMIAQKLEKLGFTYYKGRVILTDFIEGWRCV